MAGAESAEAECPCKEDGERSKKELVDWFTSHRRPTDRRLRTSGSSSGWAVALRRTSADSDRIPAVVGHLLANGLPAPLQI